MRRFWLLFSQTVTILLAIWFVVATLKPAWVQQGLYALLHKAPPTLVEESRRELDHQDSYHAAVQQAIPAVVSLTSKKIARAMPRTVNPLFHYFFGEGDATERPELSASLGSGVIVSPEGYVLTNHHVVEGADEIEVTLADGRTAQAKVVGSDPETDVAVIKIDLSDLPAITFGKIENVRVGDVVLAIGNPFDVGQTVTMGIVSALGRNHLGINTFENFIQTDAAINPGNSGGALVDSRGRLLGINTAIFSRSGGSLGIGFAIPVSTAKQIMDEIIARGSVTRGWIGIDPQDITAELAESFDLTEKKGTLVAGVVRGTPADQAGVKPGDILLEVDGHPVNDTTTLLNAISQLKPNTVTVLTIMRKRQKMIINVVVGKRPTKVQ